MRKFSNSIKLFLFVFVSSFTGIVDAQVVFSDWVITTGQKSWDIVNDIAIDSAGHILITGSNTETTSNRDKTSVTTNMRKYSYLTKYDTEGRIRWSKNIDASAPGYGKLIATTKDNKIILAGAVEPKQKTNYPAREKQDFYISCLDKNGNTNWRFTFSGNTFDCFTSLCEDTITGDICLVGYFYDTLLVQKSARISVGKSDAMFFRFDKSGQLKHLITFGGKGNDRICSMFIDRKGSASISGVFHKKVSFGNNKTLETKVPDESGVFLATYSLSGECSSTKTICSGKTIQVATMSNNGLYTFLTGSFKDFLTINNQSIASYGSDDIFVICIDDRLSIRWFKHIGGKQKDRVADIIASNDEVLLTGSFCSQMTVDNISLSSLRESSDIFILSLDTAGKINWVHQLGGEFDDYPKCMETTKDGYIYLSGSFRQTLNIGDKSIQSKGEEDVFIARLENCKKIAPKFKKPEILCEGKSITLDAGTGFTSYYWNNGQSVSNFLTVDKGGFYPLELISKNGCKIYDTVEVDETPVPDVFIGNDTIIPDTSFLVLHAGKNFKEYLWNNGGQDSINVIRGFDCKEGQNRIWVKTKNENGCEGYDEMFVTIFKTEKNAISKFLADNCFVFPNPTDDNLTVFFTVSLDNIDLTVYNQLGLKVVSRSMMSYRKDTPVIFSLGSLSQGLYNLVIKTKGGFTTKKIVLE